MKILVKFYFMIYPLLDRFPVRTGIATGIFLGLFDREDFHYLDELNAGRTDKWSSESHNLRGLLPWEKSALKSWFPSKGRLMVTAVGGGREVLALEPMGYELEAFECNPRLTDAANRHLQNHGFQTRVRICPRDEAPQVGGTFDGVIVGWGSYTLVMQRETRVEFLRTLAQRMPEGTPILLSYFKLEHPPGRAEKTQHKIASWIRTIRGAPQPETNDVIDWNFRHRFENQEIESELFAAGFSIAHISDDSYPHAVGIRRATKND